MEYMLSELLGEAKMGGKFSNNKGKTGERELAQVLRRMGFDGVRRGQQYSGGETSADLLGLEHIHMEVKRTEQFRLWAALEQAAEDAGGSGNMPVVFHRKNRRPWVAVMSLTDWARLYKAFLQEQGRDKNN